MSPTLRIGVIGAGSVARRIHAPGFDLCPNVEVAAIADPNVEAAEQIGAPQIFDDHRRLLEADIDAVVVAVPNHLHRQIALDVIASGRPILCEKPLALTVREAEQMLSAAEQAGVVHMAAFTYEFTPAARYLKHLIEQGELGEIRSVRAAYLMALSTHTLGWRSQTKLAGSGVLGDIGSHMIHIAQWLAGDIARLCARQKNFRNDPTSDVEDWISFLADFDSGAVGTFEISRVCPGRGADISENLFIEVYGSKGGAVFSLQQPRSLELAIGEDGRDPERVLIPVEIPREYWKLPGAPRKAEEGDPRWSYRYDQAYRFVENVREGVSREPSFVAGVRTQRVLDAALRSAESESWAPCR